MKIVAAVFADFARGPLGGAPTLRECVGGQSIIARTLARAARLELADERLLVVAPRDADAASDALRDADGGERVTLAPTDTGLRPRAELVQAARAWALDSWRGNPLGITWFDEFVDPVAVARLADERQADAVMCLSAYQPLLDAPLNDTMIRHYRDNETACRFVFTQAPPGLTGVLLPRDCLSTLLELQIPLGLLLAYRPEIAQADPITQPGCLQISPAIAQSVARLTGDTRRSRELIDLALAELGPDAGADELCRWAMQPGHERAGHLPVEVELELTTDDPLPDTTLRLRGARIPRRELTDLNALARVVTELASYDDRLLWLGGHGDPLRHPRFTEIIASIARAGLRAYGLATPLIDLSDEQLHAIFDHGLGVIEIQIDAGSAQMYRRVHGLDGYARVMQNIDRIEAERRQRHSARPLLVPSQTRCAATIGEMERFHDYWVSNLGTAVIHGYNNYCGRLPPDTLLPTEPPARGPCERLASRLMLLADGTIPHCGQDVDGISVLGRWDQGAIRDTWEGPTLQQLRNAHGQSDFTGCPACAACGEWFRP